jgi:hypothetical protein
MIHGGGRQVAIVALCYGALGAQRSCGMDEVTVVRRYGLSACPGANFSFPDSTGDSVYVMRSVTEHPPLCPGVKTYEFADRPAVSHMSVRLNRGGSCSLDVGYRYITMTNTKDHSGIEAEQDNFADIAAGTVFGPSEMTVIPPARKTVVRFESWKDRETWCAQTASAAKNLLLACR